MEIALAETTQDSGNRGQRDDARRAAEGDTAAFERLYRANVPRVHGLALRMLGPDLAEEVTQDVFVRAWRKLGTFRGDAAFGTWLHRLAVNVILTRRKQLGKQRQRMHHDGEHVLGRASGRRPRPELGVEFERGMRRLPDGAREIFVLHDVEGFKHHEIAEMLGVTTGTTKAQLHRARMLLRQYVSR
jgi:RNA polymerase sigma-70 factor (ECF subfamily)